MKCCGTCKHHDKDANWCYDGDTTRHFGDKACKSWREKARKRKTRAKPFRRWRVMKDVVNAISQDGRNRPEIVIYFDLCTPTSTVKSATKRLAKIINDARFVVLPRRKAK